MKNLMFSCFIVAALTYSAKAQTVITGKDAAKHIGETVSITGKIFGGKLFSNTNMILLDLGGYNPNQELTIMIPGTDKSKFKGSPDVDYKGKEVTVTGKIIEYKGKPEIVVTNPGQLKEVLIDNMRTPALPLKNPGN